MSLYESWTYAESDPALMLFTAALQAWQLPILPGQSVLEIGCNESDFLFRLHNADNTLKLTGLDWRENDKAHNGRGHGWTFVQGCAWDEKLFEPESFDWVLMLGALEHFGLGWYGDPKEPIGDELALAAIGHWLKPGGNLYFDVPFNPEYSVGAHFRTYSKIALEQLIYPDGVINYNSFKTILPLEEIACGYSLPEPQAGTWIPQPTMHREPYHFAAIWARKEN